jgi:very-short-patch-repair endonuclease
MTTCRKCGVILGPKSHDVCSGCRPRVPQRWPARAWKEREPVQVSEHTESFTHYREQPLVFGRRKPRIYTKADKEAIAQRMREEPTPGEMAMTKILREHYGARGWAMQMLLHGWIVDFLFTKERVVIEVDGSVHDRPEVKARDRVKQESLERNGYRVVRVTNNEAKLTPGAVRARLDRMLCGR